jgi:hypothetical protein
MLVGDLERFAFFVFLIRLFKLKHTLSDHSGSYFDSFS